MRALLLSFIFILALLLLLLPAQAAATPEEAFTAARQLLDAGNDQQASVAFKGFLKDFPNDGRALEANYLLGYCYENLKQYPQALTEFGKVIDKAGKPEQANWRADANFQIAECYAQQRDFAKAVLAYQACLKIDAPANKNVVDAYYWMADSLLQLNREKEALDSFAKVLELDKAHPLASWSLAAIGAIKLRAGAFDNAIAALERLLNEYATTDPAKTARLSLGLAYAGRARASKDDAARAKDFAQAETILLAAEKEAGDDATARRQVTLALARVEADRNDFTKAETAYSRALTGLEPASEEALRIRLLRANCLYNAGRYADAAKEYESLSQQKPGGATLQDALYWLGNCRYELARAAKTDKAAFAAAVTVLQRYTGAAKADDQRAMRVTLLTALAQEALLGLGEATAREAAFDSYRQLLKKWPTSLEAAEATNGIGRLTIGMDEATMARLLATLPEGAGGASIALQYARAQFQAGKYQEAVVGAQKIVKSKPEGELLAQAQLLIGAAQLRLQHPDEAVAPYEAALVASKSDDVRRYARMGLTQAYLDLRQYTKAIECAQALLKLPVFATGKEPGEQEMAERWELLALALSGNAQYPEAMDAYGTLVEKSPSSPRVPYALLNRAWLAEQAKQPDKAENDYRNLIAKYPNHEVKEDAMLRLAALYQTRGSSQQVLDLLAAIPDTSPRSDQATYARAWAYRGLKQPERAFEQFARLVEKYPKSPLAPASLFRMGEYQVEKGQFTEAQANFTRASGLLPDADPLKPAAIYMTGACAFNAHDVPGALAAFDIVLTKFATSDYAAESLFWKGQALEAKGTASAKEARALYQQYATKYPKGRYLLDAQVGAGRAALLATELAAARADLQQAINGCKMADLPTTLTERAKNLLPEAYFFLGKTLAAQAQYDAALTAYAVIAGYNLEPWYSRSLLEMARCDLSNNDRPAAQKALRLLRQKFPQSEAAKEAETLARENNIEP